MENFFKKNEEEFIENEPKSEIISFRCTPSEKAELIRLSRKIGLPVNSILRELTRHAELKLMHDIVELVKFKQRYE